MPFYKRPSRNSGSSRRGARSGMQSGPRGGKFYISRGGSKVYGPLPTPSTRKGRKAPAPKKGAGPKPAAPTAGGVRKSRGGQKAVSDAWVAKRVTSGAKKATKKRLERFTKRVARTGRREGIRDEKDGLKDRYYPGGSEKRYVAADRAASAYGKKTRGKAENKMRARAKLMVEYRDVDEGSFDDRPKSVAADKRLRVAPEKPTSKAARARLMAKSAKADKSKGEARAAALRVAIDGDIAGLSPKQARKHKQQQARFDKLAAEDLANERARPERERRAAARSKPKKGPSAKQAAAIGRLGGLTAGDRAAAKQGADMRASKEKPQRPAIAKSSAAKARTALQKQLKAEGYTEFKKGKFQGTSEIGLTATKPSGEELFVRLRQKKEAGVTMTSIRYSEKKGQVSKGSTEAVQSKGTKKKKKAAEKHDPERLEMHLKRLRDIKERDYQKQIQARDYEWYTGQKPPSKASQAKTDRRRAKREAAIESGEKKLSQARKAAKARARRRLTSYRQKLKSKKKS